MVHADSHYAAVVVSAKRARQINSYFHNLGEGSFGEYPPPMVETGNERNYLSVALEELAEGKLKSSTAPNRSRRRARLQEVVRMARILLGVSGGIAAYKSLEFARLATVAGHGVRVLMTESAGRFVGAASFEGIVGAPVLVSEFERDPLRGSFPGEPRPSTTRSATSSWPPTAMPIWSRPPLPTPSPSWPPEPPTRC